MTFCQQTNFVKKTKFMLIGSQYKLSHINKNFSVEVDNTPIDRVAEHKYLRFNINESLKWHSHIKSITKKTYASLKVFKHISPFIPFDTSINMHNALVMPYFNFRSTV